MVVDSQAVYVLYEKDRGYLLDHIYLDLESAELALRNFLPAGKVQADAVWIETLEAKRLQHCCEM